MSEANSFSTGEASKGSSREATSTGEASNAPSREATPPPTSDTSDSGRAPMYLPTLDQGPPAGPYAGTIAALQGAGFTVPQIMYLFAYKPDRTQHLSRFTHDVMRGPSPLPPGVRELIAAYTSRLNHCPF